VHSDISQQHSQQQQVHSDILQQHREQQQQVHTSLAAPFASGPLMLLAMPSPILPGLAAAPTLGSAPRICKPPHHMTHGEITTDTLASVARMHG